MTNAATNGPDTDPTRARRIAVVRMQVNGEPIAVAVPVHWTLLELLRYQLGMVGSKQGCDKGDCGACTVRLGGAPILACITLAVACDGAAVETVEGLGVGGEPHPLQREFAERGAAQCGFCTPGMLMSAAHYLDALAVAERPVVQGDAIARALSGNLCRCTGYTKIFEAVAAAAQEIVDRQAALAGDDGEGTR